MLPSSKPVVSINSKISSQELGNLGMVAGAFDEFGLEDLINKRIGKEGSHVVADSGVLVKLLVMQMLNVPYQSLSGTQEFYSALPLEVFGQQKITSEDLGRAVLSRLLDDVYEYGSEKLFLECSAQVVDSLNIKITEAHIDTTSFHSDGKSTIQDECGFYLALGYSRDHRPDLNQAICLMLADGSSGLPFYARNLSGNVNDNKSFNNMLNFAWTNIKEQFSELEYLVGDSALCTAANFADAAEQNIKLVTRVPDKTETAARCFEMFEPEKMEPIFEGDENSPEGRWCEDGSIGEQKVKLLLVSNGALKEQKSQTIRKQAQTELEKIRSAIKKMQTQPAICKADAEKNFSKLVGKVKFCKVGEPSYEEVFKQARRGRPKKGVTPEVKCVAVKVNAEVLLDEQKIAEAVEQECLYVLATNDTQREWTMAQLLGIYKRQSVIERNWRCCKDPRFFLDAIYLKTPSRIDALLWLMSLALLVYAAMEYKIRKTMSENGMEFPLFENKATQKPTLRRVFQYVGNLRIQVVKLPDGKVYITNVDDVMSKLLMKIGDSWCWYYSADSYCNLST